MHGYVVLTNISARPCTLRGVPAVTVLSRGVRVQADYARFGTGKAALTGLPPGGKANFRIDWDAPYCPNQRGELPGPPDHGPFSIHATLDGLTMTIPVHSTASPACVIGDPEPHGNPSSVAASPIVAGAAPPAPVPQASALRRLRATASAYPRQVAPGQTLRFVVALVNPASRPVSLTTPPPPSYAIDVYCARTPATPGYQFGKTYSLNTGPRAAVPAHGVVRFAMHVQIPATPPCPSPRLTITWQTPDPGFGLQGPRTSFSVAVT
jgi:hypothetical protein